MTPTTDIRNWQVSQADPHAIVEGAEDIGQCIYNILTTIEGTDPLRAEFGSKVYQFIDYPTHQVKPGLIYEATRAIGKWEERLKVTRCRANNNGLEGIIIEVEGEVRASAGQIIKITATL